MSWQQSTIEEACLLVTDGTHYTPPDVGQGIPFLTVKDLSHHGHIDLVGCSHVTEDEFEKANKKGFLTQMYARFWNDLADHASASR